MKEKLVTDLTGEKENISKQLQEKKVQESELDKALIATRKDILLLEGRLIEVNAIIDYVKSVGDVEEPAIEDEPRGN